MNWRDKFDAAKAHFLTIRSSTVQLPLQRDRLFMRLVRYSLW